jgi:N-formylglutamate deformylase
MIEIPDFQIVNPVPSVPIVAHIPHSSARIPAELRSTLLLDDAALQAEQARIVDWFTDDLFSLVAAQGGTALVNQVSRLIVDPERYVEDAKEPMASRGVGVIYERTTLQTLLRRKPSPQERAALLQRFYFPYHQAFEAMVNEILSRFGNCLIIDCHSYPEFVLPYELDHSAPRPQICIGTDKVHTPHWLRSTLANSARSAGYTVDFDTPFAGTIVPLSLYGDPRVSSVMIEINRATYMNEQRTECSSQYPSVKKWIYQCVSELIGLIGNSSKEMHQGEDHAPRKTPFSP